ncbi:MAG: glutathione peroxidase [Chitinophagaceae bacterium]|nr:MAG: glutathione peroxidase [Chitinophagaceae bacterium]
MTFKQQVLKFLYPVFNKLSLMAGKSNKILKSTNMATTSFYDLGTTLNNGQDLNFESLKNKKVLIVNTASDCGYTNQYEGLQELHEKYKDKLTIIGFPANDFGEQEKGSDATIEQFCKVNYGVTFPLAKKSTVIKKEDQHPVYKWLTDESRNGWNHTAPTWNFCKYLIDENGELTHFFEAAIEPMSKEMISALEESPSAK